MLTARQAWAIANLVAELRPEWQAQGTVAALKPVADRDPFLVALASIRAAADKDARTPGVIPTPGTHWQDGIKQTPPPRSYNQPCPIHPDQTLPCGRCANATAPSPVAKLHLDQARAELHAVKSRLCSHGVERRACRETHDQPETDSTEETP